MERRHLLGKQSGYILYAITEVNKKYGDNNFINPLSIGGNGIVTYTSSNTTAATIDSGTGEVTIIAPGTTIITATTDNTLDYIYDTKTATYTLIIGKADGNVSDVPVALSITYDESSHYLVSLGSGTGTMMYKLGDGEWDTVIPSAINAGTYIVYYKASETVYYSESNVGTVSVTIQKANPVYTAPIATSPVYNTTALNLLVAGSTSNGLIEYSDDGTTWSTTIPLGTNAGLYTSYWRLTGSSNYNDINSTSIITTIDKVTPTIVDPIGNELTYNASSLNLITAGTTDLGTLKYSLDGITYNTTVPTGINAGDYTVYYKVEGDSNIYDVQEQTILVTISKVTPTLVSPTGLVIIYDGEEHELISAGSTNYGTLLYSLDNITYSQSIPTASAQDTYTVWYKVAGDSNINDIDPLFIYVTLGGIVVENPTIVLDDLYNYVYNGSEKEPTIVVYDDDNNLISSDEYTITYSDNIDAGTATITITDVEGGHYTINGSVTFTITKASISPIVSIDDWTYGDTASTPSVSGNTGGGSVTYTYSSDGTNYSSDIPINAGNYYIKVEIDATSNYQSGEATNTFTIAKADASYTAPTAKTGLIYNGSGQDLLNAGSTNDGTILYSSDDSTWSTTIPQGTSATTYTSYWRLVGDNNHNDVSSSSISTSIEKVTPTVTAPTPKSSLVYNGSALTLINAGSTNFGTIKYSLNNLDWSTSLPSGTNGGIYTIYYKVDGDDNINSVASAQMSPNAAIGEKSVTASITLDPSSYTYSGNACTPSVVAKDGSTVIPSSEYSVSYSNNTNAGTATVTLTDNTGGNYAVIGSTTFTIARANISPSVSMSGWTYGGTASSPSVSGNSGSGTVTYYYKVSGAADSTYSTTKPSNAGTYTVKAEIALTTNYNSGSCTTNFTISKADQSAPTATGATTTYNTTATATASGGGQVGSLEWESAQSQTSVGSHSTRARWSGNSNYNPSPWSNSVTVQMNKASGSAYATANGWTYNGNSYGVIYDAGGYGSLLYLLEGGSWLTTIPTAVNAGTYKCRVYSPGDANHNEAYSGWYTCTVSKASQGAPTAYGATVTYGSTATATTSGGGGVGSIEWSNGSSRSATGSQDTQARWSGNSNYNASGWSNVVTLTVNKAGGSAWATANSWTYDGNTRAMATNWGGYGTLYFIYGGTWYSSILNANGAGSYSFLIYSSGDANHEAAYSGTYTCTVSKASQSAPTAYGSTVAYGSTAYASASGGGGVGSIEWSNGNSLSGNAGSSKTTYARWTGNSNYNASGWSNGVTLSIVKANLSAPTAYGATVTYGSTAYASASGGGGAGSIEWSNGSSRSATGSQTTYARWSGNSNYNASGWSNGVTLTVNKATPSITATPYNANRTYSRGALYLLAGGTANVAGSWSYTTGTNAGSYSAYWTFTPSDTTNYNSVSGGPITATILKATPVLSTSPTNVTGLTYTGTTYNLAQGGAMKHSSSDSTAVAGSWSYTREAGSGTYATYWYFTPNDTTNYNSTNGRLSGNTTIAISTTLPVTLVFNNNTSSAIVIRGKFEFRVTWSSYAADGGGMAFLFQYGAAGVNYTVNANSSYTFSNVTLSGDSSKWGRCFADLASLTAFSNHWRINPVLTANIAIYNSSGTSDAIKANNFPSSGLAGLVRGGATYYVNYGGSNQSYVSGG